MPSLVAEPLALHGGKPTITRPFRPYNSYGAVEGVRAQEVIASGVLSGFVADRSADFYGGPRVKKLEKAWAEAFEVRHAIAVNSATSGLIAAVGALGVGRGDEVIVSPWTMTATATAILAWGATPVFVDIEPETFGLDPEAVAQAITPRTEAIIVTDIFGHAAMLDELLALADEHNLPVIEDAAQCPGAREGARKVGTIGDIGVFSLNRHKHIHCGEGGVVVTKHRRYAQRLQLIRNHGEVVSEDPSVIGFNLRLGEIEAAMAVEQLAKLPQLIQGRADVGQRLAGELKVRRNPLRGLRLPIVRQGCSHVFYVFPLVLNPKTIRVSRNRIVAALRAEGVPGIGEGYENLHLLPLHGLRYRHLPVAERLHLETLITLETCGYEFTPQDTRLVGEAFRKVWDNLDQLA